MLIHLAWDCSWQTGVRRKLLTMKLLVLCPCDSSAVDCMMATSCTLHAGGIDSSVSARGPVAASAAQLAVQQHALGGAATARTAAYSSTHGSTAAGSNTLMTSGQAVAHVSTLAQTSAAGYAQHTAQVSIMSSIHCMWPTIRLRWGCLEPSRPLMHWPLTVKALIVRDFHLLDACLLAPVLLDQQRNVQA